MDGERLALLTLTLTPGVGVTLIGRCIEAFGSAEATLGASAAQLAGLERIGQKKAGEIRRGIDAVRSGDALRRELDAIESHGARLLCLDDADYPRLLKHTPDPPRLLWVRGELRDEDALAVGVVGARKCTAYGREQADRFGAACADAGLTVVSGGAYGVDIAAHRAVLRVKGRTVAVLGSGLAKPYPEPHVADFERIVGEGCGAVVSELPMLAPPMAENFPRRNRIISGLSLGVLVIEAAKRSGALITARKCVDEHGREVMAVPGRVDSPMSEGCHQMLREGWAKLVTNVGDVLECLGEAGEMLRVGMERKELASTQASLGAGGEVDGFAKPQGAAAGVSLFEVNLSEGQRCIVDALDAPRSLDEITQRVALPVAQVQVELTMLELRGAVRRENGRFVRRRS